jgi:hypothetical protein
MEMPGTRKSRNLLFFLVGAALVVSVPRSISEPLSGSHPQQQQATAVQPSTIDLAASRGIDEVEVNGLQRLGATVVVSRPLSIRANGSAARIDCRGLQTAFFVR